jgi:hypothetical protein
VKALHDFVVVSTVSNVEILQPRKDPSQLNGTRKLELLPWATNSLCSCWCERIILFQCTELCLKCVCFVCTEDHCDILPFLNACVRAKLMPIEGVEMLHFDSHPDMSIPSAWPTSEWAQKQFPEQLMGSLSGISEFLVPLLYTRRLDKVGLCDD